MSADHKAIAVDDPFDEWTADPKPKLLTPGDLLDADGRSVNGLLKASFVVDKNGSVAVHTIDVTKNETSVSDAAVRLFLGKLRFEPGRIFGKPVLVKYSDKMILLPLNTYTW